MSVFHKILRAGEGRTLKRLEQRVVEVNALEPEYEALSDEQLAAKTIEFRERFDQGEDLQHASAAGGVRGRPRGLHARPGPAPFRRPADRRHGAARAARSPR